MNNSLLYIAGIGTNVGKTVVSSIIVEALQADYWKPIQCGDLTQSDTIQVKNLISNSHSQFHPEVYRLRAPESPHYAASLENKVIEKERFIIPQTKNSLVIESAGGVCVPVNKTEFLLDYFPKNIPLILVSKNELGSINQTLLSLYYLVHNQHTKIAIVFVGEAKPSSESIIIEHYPIEVIGRIPWEEKVPKEFVRFQAQRLKHKILNFLQE